ncbi:EF-hand domain-containing protein [Pontibacter roseus]|uniref:EF-hand domain-containing protein n=1 Tax=Pontibacter roseus TaxID=336989 RepID=UPI00038096A2|nr:EF-hand domain-containing protein [Pontibacter roseus]
MKRYTRFYLLLPFLALLACDEEVDAPTPKLVPDTVAPAVTILTPMANDSLLVIGAIHVTFEIMEDKELDNVRVVLATPGSDAQIISNANITSYHEYQRYHMNLDYLLPKNSQTGTYTLTVEAKDRSQNMGNRTVVFTLHDSDISQPDFSMPFFSAFSNSKVAEALNGERFNYWEAGFNNWDYGYVFDANWLSKVLLIMAATNADYTVSEADWQRFMVDFGIKNQSWTKWDQDKDGILTEAEFEKGIDGLELLKEWDKSQDELVDLDEMAVGVFTRWDQNKNGKLSKAEYLEKFYAYFYR